MRTADLQVGVGVPGKYRCVLDTDANEFGGLGRISNTSGVWTRVHRGSFGQLIAFTPVVAMMLLQSCVGSLVRRGVVYRCGVFAWVRAPPCMGYVWPPNALLRPLLRRVVDVTSTLCIDKCAAPRAPHSQSTTPTRAITTVGRAACLCT